MSRNDSLLQFSITGACQVPLPQQAKHFTAVLSIENQTVVLSIENQTQYSTQLGVVSRMQSDLGNFDVQTARRIKQDAV